MKLKNYLCMMANLAVVLALCGPASAADVIGDVAVVEVWAYGTPPDQARRDLRANMQVYVNERVETVKQAEVLIRFLDGTTLGIGAESSIVLDELVYDPNQVDSMVLSMTQGLFHFVTGDIAPEAVTIMTPAMIIGIRGTDIAVSVDSTSTELGVRDGNATATPTAGGETVSVGAGETARATVGDRGVSVSLGLSDATGGAMPGSSGIGSGGFGGGGGGRGGGEGGGSGGGY